MLPLIRKGVDLSIINAEKYYGAKLKTIAIRAGVVKNQKLEKNSETLAHSQFPIPHS